LLLVCIHKDPIICRLRTCSYSSRKVVTYLAIVHASKPQYGRDKDDCQNQHPPSPRARPLYRRTSNLSRRLSRRHRHSLHSLARHHGSPEVVSVVSLASYALHSFAHVQSSVIAGEVDVKQQRSFPPLYCSVQKPTLPPYTQCTSAHLLFRKTVHNATRYDRRNRASPMKYPQNHQAVAKVHK
jgi:hypothetical protein